MSAWTCRYTDDKADPKIVPPRPRIPWWKGLGADSEEKHEPVSDIDTVAMDGLKALDPKRPIREADIQPRSSRCLLRGQKATSEEDRRAEPALTGYRRSGSPGYATALPQDFGGGKSSAMG